MNEIIEQVIDTIRSAWRFRWPALLVAFVVALLGWVVVFALPDSYQADARVFVDTRTALKPVLQGLVVEQDVNAEINFVRQSLLAGPQLKKIAEETGVLAPTVTDPALQSRILLALANRVTLSVKSASDREDERNTAGTIYGISYTDSDRARSLKVVQALKNTLVEETLGGKREGSENAQKFLEAQIKDYEQRLRAAEDRLADFKKRNVGLMPTEQGGYFAQLQTELDAAKKAETDLAIATSRRGELEKQLRGETAITATSSSAPGANGNGGVGDTVSRIREAQARLDELLLRFTDRHPDVIAARATLDDLKKRRQQEIELLRSGDANAAASSGASSNPVYQSIQLAMNQAEVELTTLRGQLAQHRAKVGELQKRLDTAPKVEAEYAQLNRDYDVNKAQYTALLASYQKAQIGERADNAGSVRFEVVQPPTASFKPVSPPRGLLLGAALLLGMVAGIGWAYLFHMMRPVVGSARALAEFTGLPVLSVVGVAFPEQVSANRRRQSWAFAAGAASLLVAFVAVIALNRAGIRLSLQSMGLVLI